MEDSIPHAKRRLGSQYNVQKSDIYESQGLPNMYHHFRYMKEARHMLGITHTRRDDTKE